MKVAVLDLGTNTFHLMIVEVSKGRAWEKLVHRKITVKLGQGGIHRNLIAPRPFKRGINAIAEFRKEIDSHGVRRIVAFGTAALRTADNGKDFLAQIKKHYGITVNLISGDAEALLIYKGVRKAVDMSEEVSLIMDIGGGSTEFILVNEKKLFWKQSFRIGASMLLEKFRPSDPVKKTEISQMEGCIDEVLKPLWKAIKKHHPSRLIGSAGSFETVASMIRHRNPAAGSHYGKKSHPIAFGDLNSLFRDIIKSDTAERKKMKGLISMRVDMIVPASILLNFVLRKSAVKDITLSAYSLKEGAVEYILEGHNLKSLIQHPSPGNQ